MGQFGEDLRKERE
jgi:cytoskeleton protein RodZ